jgi:hypothetical protein
MSRRGRPRLPKSEWPPERRDAFVAASRRVFPGSYEPFRGESATNEEVEAMERHLDSFGQEIRDAEMAAESEQLSLDDAA